jgi:hypothetical protein
VAVWQFGPAFEASSGLIRIPGNDYLSPIQATIPQSRLKDPYVADFLRRNPDYAQGVELACLAPVRQDNLNAYARRVIRDTTPVWQC